MLNYISLEMYQFIAIFKNIYFKFLELNYDKKKVYKYNVIYDYEIISVFSS